MHTSSDAHSTNAVIGAMEGADRKTVGDIPEDVRRRLHLAATRVRGEGIALKNPKWLQRLLWGHYFGRTCMDCGCRMIFATQQNSDRRVWPILATVDHVRQQCDGGSDDDTNVQVVCQSCNTERQLSHRTQNRCGRDRARVRLHENREQAALHAYSYQFPHHGEAAFPIKSQGSGEINHNFTANSLTRRQIP